MKETLIERLTRYAKIDTQSDARVRLARQQKDNGICYMYLEKELAEIGLEEITLDENGYLFATLPSNTDKDLPTIGFLAHVDTATDYTGKNVNPQRIEKYDGQDIKLK